VQRRDLTGALQLLNTKETNHEGRWQTDNREMTSAVKFLDNGGTLAASRIEPQDAAEALRTSFDRISGLDAIYKIQSGTS
jgi:hypothetical protein